MISRTRVSGVLFTPLEILLLGVDLQSQRNPIFIFSTKRNVIPNKNFDL